ncbi:undecaprenyldiphospho-muramoylpentapeptide beta-N-acetylglucosaminyltransferase [Hoeflea sp. J2-29]|uniref:UDP-N-acetylglucosamine--N-acetylmuramyl-(pentapeptide) pyrophosphoryl-undecaprenol N-acetylglucosamine transferase n=2 Tax=Hoeflea ulvae TaxID=2983764 RepID=A0ABT3YJU4_9HYPH|nr:undecaprenyldiphospho-muramoylpentapeptide beta-N-acetylglucosaminyltransferase [Hoeflea ulvae]MCY0096015.1 undecaprenyldiphospho-muramoylpentapeptide beta-N-acetylglucosaminyltransferase [Hoeflea ulvae]
MAESKLFLLSAGGTGGHLFPAEALAHELIARGHRVHLVTDSRAARFAGTFPASEIHVVRSATIGSKNPVKVIKSLWTLFKGVREAGKLMRSIRPDAVIGFGGYPTIPPLLAASNAGLPTMVHEQNAVMGRANKALASRVKAIAGGFLPEGRGAHASKIVITGNPVRPEVIAAADIPYVPSEAGETFRLVVFGGSQGAQFFSEAIPAAIGFLPQELRARLDLVQQARPEDEAHLRTWLEELGVKAEVSPFFNDMASRIAAAHLVISRSGASTVSEIAVIGRSAILVPYPFALDHDQAANAAALMAMGGASVIKQGELTPKVLSGMIADRMNDPTGLAATAAAARATGKPDAARLLADLAEAIAGGITPDQFRSTHA